MSASAPYDLPGNRLESIAPPQAGAMRLYYSPGACSLAPHIVAREAGISVELAKVDLASKTIETGADYRSVNPKGSVPALVLQDGTVLTEAAVICLFIADLKPESGLMPGAGTLDRYRALEWLGFISTELHKSFSLLWRKETPAEARTIVKQAIGAKLDFLDRHIEGRDFLLGESFSAADAYAFTILCWCRYVGIDLAHWPRLESYVERIAVRPGVRAALAAEGLLSVEAA